MIHTYTRTHVFISFANPYLACDRCGDWVTSWHDNDSCGCASACWNHPCGHIANATSRCSSWSPVDGCSCLAMLGSVKHGEPPARGAATDTPTGEAP